MSKFLGGIFKGNPLASITIGSVVSALGGYALAHFDPSKLTPVGVSIFGVASTIIGVLTHHNNQSTGQ